LAVTISNIGFMISVLGDFTVDRQTASMSIGSGVIYLHRATPRAASHKEGTLEEPYTIRLFHERPSQLRSQDEVDREELGRRAPTLIGLRVVDCPGNHSRVEIGTKGRELPNEQIVHDAIDLQLLGELIRPVQVCHPVVRELDGLVGLVADISLAADPDQVGTE